MWVKNGVFESIMRDAGKLVEERDGFRLYECFIDGTFSKARGGGDGIGLTKAGKGVKIMVLVDARGLPVAVTTGSASPHESTLVQGLFEFMLSDQTPERIIGDKAYDSDGLDMSLDRQGDPTNRAAPGQPQTGEHHAGRTPAAPIPTQMESGENNLVDPNFRRLCIRYEKSTSLFQGFLHLGCTMIMLKQVLG